MEEGLEHGNQYVSKAFARAKYFRKGEQRAQKTYHGVISMAKGKMKKSKNPYQL